jgi:hypothetical protein
MVMVLALTDALDDDDDVVKVVAVVSLASTFESVDVDDANDMLLARRRGGHRLQVIVVAVVAIVATILFDQHILHRECNNCSSKW